MGRQALSLLSITFRDKHALGTRAIEEEPF